MKIELIKDNKIIGNIILIKDNQGGGLNGGCFFSSIDNLNVLEKEIPLFEDYKIYTT